MTILKLGVTMPDNNNFNWGVIYQEANEHLREQDKKRDQTIAFFAVITGYFSGSEIFSGNEYSFVLNLLLFITGLVVLLILIRFKNWHEKYVVSIVCISKAMKLDELSPAIFNTIYIDSIKQKNIKFREVFWSSESLVINLFVLVNSANLFFTIYNFFGGYIMVYIFVISLSLSFVFANIFVYSSMKKVYSSNNYNDIWLLRLWSNNER
jgi:hypothetical protein